MYLQLTTSIFMLLNFYRRTVLDKEESFMRVLEYQRLKYTLEQQGIIKPDNTNTIYIILAFIGGCIIGSLLPW